MPRLAHRVGVPIMSVILCSAVLLFPANAEPPGTQATPADMQKLYDLLPKGYVTEDCDPVAPVGNQLASIDCGLNTLADEVLGVTYALYTDTESLHSAFIELIGGYKLVTCPGLDPSPTTWHYSDAPDVTAGSLACAEDEPLSEVIWSDDANTVLAEADSLDYIAPLYQWWRAES